MRRRGSTAEPRKHEITASADAKEKTTVLDIMGNAVI